MTEKLFYQDAYCKSFTAKVTGCVPRKEGYAVTLDRTAFYPEGGGQPGDTGRLGAAQVLDTHEKDGEVWHYTDLPLEGTVEGAIDWDRRFAFMQHHTGEHILSGILHRLYGVDNVGFHMGRDATTIDLNAELTAEQLSEAQRQANEAIYADRAVEIAYPTPAQLQALAYRSKKELTGAVRIVTVPDSDVCACCGTHLIRTGEIGMVKITSFQRYKGGVRVGLLCGRRALADYDEKLQTTATIAGMLSVKPEEAVIAVTRLSEELLVRKQELSTLRGRYFALRAAEYTNAGDVCLFEEDLAPDELRRFAVAVGERCGGIAAVFGGSAKAGWKYALASQTTDVRMRCKELNAAFSGRGGGTQELVQGSLTATRTDLELFFAI